MEIFADARAHLLLGQGVGTMRVQEVMTQPPCFLLQLGDAESADRLHKIGRHSHQQTHFFLKSTWYRWFGQDVTPCGVWHRHHFFPRCRFHAPIKIPNLCKGNVLWYWKQPKCEYGSAICKKQYVCMSSKFRIDKLVFILWPSAAGERACYNLLPCGSVRFAALGLP